MTRKIEGLAKVIGHRGAKGHAPENTIAAIRRAAALGAAWVEVDVRLTADGRLVLMHDETLERTTDGHGLVEEATLAEIAALDAGAWYAPEFAGELVPTLEEFIDTCRELGLRMNIEIKVGRDDDDDLGRSAALFLETHIADDEPPPLVSSKSIPALDAFLGVSRRFPCSFVIVGAIPGDTDLTKWRGRFAAIHALASAVTAPDVARAKTQGYVVMAFTVNDAESATRLFEWGVDAVFTDYPDRLLTM